MASSSIRPGVNWEAMWSGGIAKGNAFDVGGVSPTLLNALQRIPQPVAGAAALVPGAGRAYDALALVDHGFDRVVAVDISQTACEAAKKELKDSGSRRAQKVQVVNADFFDFDHAPFDFVWDCTFLCALDPALRKEWAVKTANLLKPETGALATCIFPIFPNARSGGPPYHMSVDLVRKLLEPVGVRADVLDQNLPKEALHLTGRLTPAPTTALGIWKKYA